MSGECSGEEMARSIPMSSDFRKRAEYMKMDMCSLQIAVMRLQNRIMDLRTCNKMVHDLPQVKTIFTGMETQMSEIIQELLEIESHMLTLSALVTSLQKPKE